jgi:putative Mn2+ efflux pump MntP
VGYDRLADHKRRFKNVKVACFEFIMPVINVFCIKFMVRYLKCVDRVGASALIWLMLCHQTTKLDEYTIDVFTS